LPLYDGIVDIDYPNPHFHCVLEESESDCAADRDRPMSRFVERYQRFMAFDVPKIHEVAYARSIDIADYYHRHFRCTPRTVFVSKTDHVTYDKWWLCHWCDDRILVPRERVPPATRISTLMSQRRRHAYFKDPLSYEYILVEDQRRSIRFERACPNPIWWFDYAQHEQSWEGSTISHTETPDVDVLSSGWVSTEATFPDYAIVLWDVPATFGGDTANVQTDVAECIVAWNRDGEYHLVLFFDLTPDLELHVSLVNTTTSAEGSTAKRFVRRTGG
jgi:hypothetical protein